MWRGIDTRSESPSSGLLPDCYVVVLSASSDRQKNWSGRDWPVTGGAKVRSRHLLRNFVAGPRVPAPLMSLLKASQAVKRTFGEFLLI